MKIEVISPHGFCAGVTAALHKAQHLLAADYQLSTTNYQLPTVYCLHELVHNEIVVGELKRRGMKFVEKVEEIPEGATVLFSAHGVSPSVRASADARNLKVVDATCPFVEKVHKAARDFAAKGLPVVVIGNPDHAEVRGIVGEVKSKGERVKSKGEKVKSAVVSGVVRGLDDAKRLKATLNDSKIGVVSQTTMNADEVKAIVEELKRDYEVETMAEVCNATKLRQDAVKEFSARHESEPGAALLVLGSVNSSNTRRLCEVAACAKVFRAGNLDEVKALDFTGVEILGVTSGASTPESFFDEAIEYLKEVRT